MVGIALAVASGMLFGALAAVPLSMLLIAAVCCLLITGCCLRTRIGALSALCSVALVSTCHFVLSAFPLSGAEIDRLQPELPLDQVELIGRVCGETARRSRRSGKGSVWMFPVKCEGLQRDGVWRRCRGRLQVCVIGAGDEQHFRRGQRIRFAGALQNRDYPGGDPVELIVRTPDAPHILEVTPQGLLFGWGDRLRRAGAETLGNGIEQYRDQVAVFRALLLGYRKEVPDEIHQQFRRTGTLHIFAISGLHVGIVGLLITLVLKSVGVPRGRWGLWLLPLLGGYVWITGMKTSALRALTMAGIFFLAPLFRRRPDIPVSIACAAIVLLWYKPMEIISIGFIFSFTVVSFIVMVFARVPERVLFRGAGWLRGVRAYIGSLGITSAAAFIASMPVTALFFGTFAPISLAANLVVVPLTFCIVLSGWLSMLVPPVSAIFNHAALVFIDLLLGTVGLLSRLPGAHMRIPPPPLTALLFWYWGWIHLLVHARTARQRSTALLLIVLAVALSLIRSCSGI